MKGEFLMTEKNNILTFKKEDGNEDLNKQVEKEKNVEVEEETIVESSDGTLSLDFFGDLKAKEEEERKNREAEAMKNSSKTKKTASPEKKEAKKEVKKEQVRMDGEWIIAYAAQNYRVTEFVTLNDGESIEAEDLRKKMEEEFFELSKERTHFEYDKERKIVFPIVKGTSKGASVCRFHLSTDELCSNSKRLQYVPSDDGNIYEVKDGLIGRMVTKSNKVPFLETIRDSFTLNLPKIPTHIMNELIGFFRHYCTRDEENEVMVQIFWDYEAASYHVHVPKQVVSKVRVNARYDHMMKSPRYQIVMEIHSHNSMDAYFSKIDDASEVAFMLYGVVGRLDQEKASMKIRVGYNGHFILLPLDKVCEPIDLSYNGTFPVEWVNNVTTISQIVRGNSHEHY